MGDTRVEVVSGKTVVVPFGSQLLRGERGVPGPPGNVAETRIVLAAVNAVPDDAWYLSEAGREGDFVFRAGNFSAAVAADPEQAFYVAPASDPTGAGGAWVRAGLKSVTIDQFYRASDGNNYGSALVRLATFCAASGSEGVVDAKVYPLPADTDVNISGQYRLRGVPGNRLDALSANGIAFRGSPTLIDLDFKGPLSDLPQYRLVKDGVADAFASPTYIRIGTTPTVGTVSGFNETVDAPPTWTANLAGNLLSVNFGSVDAGQIRQFIVESAFIPVDVGNRYMFDPLSGFLAGEMGLKARFYCYDASNNLLGEYDPQTASGNTAFGNVWFAMIRTAAKIKIRLGQGRWIETANNLTAVYDLSKLRLYQLLDYHASIDVTGAPPTNTGNVTLLNCTEPKVYGCKFSNMTKSALQVQGCTDADIDDIVIRKSMQGVSDFLSTGTRVTNWDMDLSMPFDGISSGMIGQRAYRHRCIGGSTNDRMVINSGIGRGASWGIEVLPYDTAGTGKTVDVSNVTLFAEFCGISFDGTGPLGRARATNCNIYLSASGRQGLEGAGGSYGINAKFINCNVTYADQCWFGYGVATSTGANIEVLGGNYDAPIPIGGNGGVGGGSVVFSPDTVIYGHSACYLIDMSLSFLARRVTLKRNLATFGFQRPEGIYARRTAFTGFLSFDVNGGEMAASVHGMVNFMGMNSFVLKGNNIFDDGRAKTELIRLTPQTGTALAGVMENNVARNSIATVWAQHLGAPPAGSLFLARNNRFNNGAADTIANVPANMLRGSTGLAAFVVNWAAGLIAANGRVQVPLTTMGGAAGGEVVNVTPFGGTTIDPGLAFSVPYVNSSGQPICFLENRTGAGITPATFSVQYTGGKP